MPKDKMTEEEKNALQKGLQKASISDKEIYRLAEGIDESGEITLPVDGEEDLISAAASALEFVEGLETPETKPSPMEGSDAVAGFDALLRKLETLRSDISSLQRGVVGVFAAQLLTFRGKVVELKSGISNEMVDKLRMPMFKSVIESAFAETVDTEFAALEKELVDKIVDQTQMRFKEFAARVRESEMDLRSTIVEQQGIVRSFMQSLEEDALAVRDEVSEKEKEIKKLEQEIQKLHARLDLEASSESSAQELSRTVGELQAEIGKLTEELSQKEATIQKRASEIEEARAETEEVRMKLGEVMSELEVYKTEKKVSAEPSKRADTEYQALEEKVSLLEDTLANKRKESEEQSAKIKELETRFSEAEKEAKAAKESAQKRLSEVENMQDRILEVKELEEKIYDLENEIKRISKETHVLEMQKTAFEKATKLVEKERNIALQERDLAKQRAERYIRVLGVEAQTKVLLLVDEVGSVSFADLGKALGIPAGLAAKHARELEKLGVLRVDDERAYSTLETLDLEEGEVKVD